jgi:hypothetical protein
MIIQLQFSEIMGCANLFQRFLALAVYWVSTPSILLTRVHNVTWLVHKWSFINTCVICYVLKRISSSMLHFSSIIFFIRSVIFFILIFIENPGLPLLWNQREKWLLFQVLTKEKWETTGRSGESTERSQNIFLIVPLFTFAGHYRGIRML